MANNISDYLENGWLNTVRGGGNGTTYTAPAAVYVKLHTATANETGTQTAAGETTRQAVTFAAASGGSMASNADVTWTSVSTSETYVSVSLWDNVSAGNCLWSGDLTASKAVTAGDTFTIPSGSLTLALN